MRDGAREFSGDKVFPVEGNFVPAPESVIAPSVVAEVFSDTVLPFSTNPDGSVNTSVYAAWLKETWAAGIHEFELQSTIIADNVDGLSTSAAVAPLSAKSA